MEYSSSDYPMQIRSKLSRLTHLEEAQYFANVEKAVVNEKLSEKYETVIDIYFQNTRTIAKRF